MTNLILVDKYIYICYDLKKTPKVWLCDEVELINVFKQSSSNE